MDMQTEMTAGALARRMIGAAPDAGVGRGRAFTWMQVFQRRRSGPQSGVGRGGFRIAAASFRRAPFSGLARF